MLKGLSDFLLSIGVHPIVGGFLLGVAFCFLLYAIKQALRIEVRDTKNDELSRFRDPDAFSGSGSAVKAKVSYRVNGEVKSLPDLVSDQVMRALNEGKKIEAVKIVKDATGLGLKESKDIVDHWGETLS